MKNLRDFVRQYDYDRYLVTLCLPQFTHNDLWALLAFNVEIAKTREVVNETAIGHIRLQWWRDRVRDLFDGQAPPDEPVLKGLAPLIARGAVQPTDFETLIHAREFDLEGVLPADIKGLETYADVTGAPLLRLMEGVSADAEDDAIRQHVAVAYGLMGLVRAWPIHWADGACFFPHTVLMRYGLSEADLNRRDALDGPAMRAIMRDLAQQALEHAAPLPRTPLARGMRHVALSYARALRAVDYSALRLYRRGRLPWLPVTLALYGAR